jgi:hypothetical protein
MSEERVLVNPLRISPATLNDLEAHLLLCYTGGVRLDELLPRGPPEHAGWHEALRHGALKAFGRRIHRFLL